MRTSVNASLEKLRTDYIDLLYVHWWDYDTSVPEIMDGLHNGLRVLPREASALPPLSFLLPIET